eukprot:6178260-Pleurochrysis_carterae.AAC.2
MDRRAVEPAHDLARSLLRLRFAPEACARLAPKHMLVRRPNLCSFGAKICAGLAPKCVLAWRQKGWDCLATKLML